MLLHNKRTLVQEGSGYPRNGTPMGVSTLALARLTITLTKQFIVKLDFISFMIYNAMPPYVTGSAKTGHNRIFFRMFIKYL